MKRLCAGLFAIAFLGNAMAANVNIVVPDAVAAEGVELCEALRVELGAREPFTVSDCATVFFRDGLRAFKARELKRTQRAVIVAERAAEDAQYVEDFPIPYDVMICGDGIVDSEAGEECDDGNTENGDGCSAACLAE